MQLTPSWWAFWTALLGLPLAFFALTMSVSELDGEFGTSSFHFYVVSATALAAAAACLVVIALMEALRETRLLFLGLAFLSIAAIFSVHGLATPGHILEHGYAIVPVSSWLSVTTAAVFVTLSVVNLPEAAHDWLKRRGSLILAVVTLLLGAYVGVSLTRDEWLEWVPIQERPVQIGATAFSLGLLGLGAWRYFQAFLFARLPSQWAMVCVLILLMEVQVSLTWGRFWHYSWWLYHALYGVAFLVLFAGWFIEWRRAGSVRVIAEALSMRDAIAQLNHGYTQPIADLVDAIEWKDLYTLGHVRRVASYAVMIGKELGLSTLELRALALAAQMHDVGKIGVPDRILTKPGPLTPAEYEVIKRHAERGHEIASRVRALAPALDGIRYHHERVDGTGYPRGLPGEEIPLQARIVAVADAFDAMTSGRVYQPAISREAAFAELERCSGSHFDPVCVAAFRAAMAKVRDETPAAKADNRARRRGLAA